MDLTETTTTAAARTRPRRWVLGAGAVCGAAVGAALWGTSTAEVAHLLVVLPAVYVVAAASGRPRTAWTALVVLTATFALAPLVSVPAGLAVAGVALVMSAIGAARGHGHDGGLVQLAVGTVFVAAAAGALSADEGVAAVVLAAAWAAHAAWDLLHLRTRRVVPATYAAWCAALDLVVAAGLLVGV